jgi:hypothetical protein
MILTPDKLVAISTGIAGFQQPKGCAERFGLILSKSCKDEYGLHVSEKRGILSELQGKNASHLGLSRNGLAVKG